MTNPTLESEWHSVITGSVSPLTICPSGDINCHMHGAHSVKWLSTQSLNLASKWIETRPNNSFYTPKTNKQTQTASTQIYRRNRTTWHIWTEDEKVEWPTPDLAGSVAYYALYNVHTYSIVYACMAYPSRCTYWSQFSFACAAADCQLTMDSTMSVPWNCG